MTAPFSDPLFSQVARRELQLAEAALRFAEHTGNDDYLAPAIGSSGADSSPPRSDGPIGRATADVINGPNPPVTECSPAAPPVEPGRLVPTREQHVESSRIQLLIANHRWRAAERERLEDLAHTQEWMR